MLERISNQILSLFCQKKKKKNQQAHTSQFPNTQCGPLNLASSFFSIPAWVLYSSIPLICASEWSHMYLIEQGNLRTILDFLGELDHLSGKSFHT